MVKNVVSNFYFFNLIIYLFIFYLIISTGYFSDDFSEINRLRQNNELFSLLPSFNYVNIPILHYTHYLFYAAVGFQSIYIISVIKFFYVALCCYISSKFFSLFTDKYNALTIAFLFLFWPTHESTVYWHLGQYLMLTIAFYLYSYYLIEKGYKFSGIIMAFMASFISYGSFPVAISLAILFLLNKSLMKSLYLIVPNLIYIIYYIFVSKLFSVSSVSRIPDSIQFVSIIKNYVFQIASSIDSNFGLSFLLKIYYALLNLNLFSIVICSFVIILFFFIYKNKKNMNLGKERINIHLVISFIAIILVSMLMFSVTGSYFQTPFNLGNRVMIYSALLISYLFIVIINKNHSIIFKFFFIIILFSIIGISNHWKIQTQMQLATIDNIKKSTTLSGNDYEKIIFVTGNQYSQYGKISHIEFFSESHVAEAVFGITGYENLNIKTLNSAWDFDGRMLIDKKYNHRKYEIENEIIVYDSFNDELINIPNHQIETYINSLPKSKRHWIQLISNTWVQDILNQYFPRFNYLF